MVTGTAEGGQARQGICRCLLPDTHAARTVACTASYLHSLASYGASHESHVLQQQMCCNSMVCVAGSRLSVRAPGVPSLPGLLPKPSLSSPARASANLGRAPRAWVCSHGRRRSLPVGHARSVSGEGVPGQQGAGGRAALGSSGCREAASGRCGPAPCSSLTLSSQLPCWIAN